MRATSNAMPLDVAESFAALFDLPTEIAARCMVEPNTGCVIWLGALNRGHGRVNVGGVFWYVHVLCWVCARGPVPPGLVLDHRCRVRACVRLDHLRPITSRENTLCGEGPTAVNARRETCGRCGGPYDEPRGKRTVRQCRACKRAADRRYRERRRPHG